VLASKALKGGARKAKLNALEEMACAALAGPSFTCTLPI